MVCWITPKTSEPIQKLCEVRIADEHERECNARRRWTARGLREEGHHCRGHGVRKRRRRKNRKDVLGHEAGPDVVLASPRTDPTASFLTHAAETFQVFYLSPPRSPTPGRLKNSTVTPAIDIAIPPHGENQESPTAPTLSMSYLLSLLLRCPSTLEPPPITMLCLVRSHPSIQLRSLPL